MSNQTLNDLIEGIRAEVSTNVFRPVKTTEAAMESRDAINGFVYFATDTKKIYLGSDDKYIPMGGNSGVFYGVKTFTEADIAYPVFNINDIEGDQLPMPGDLIINIGSNVTYNGFYKVIDITDESNVLASYLSVGGGGGSGGQQSSGSALIDYIFPSSSSDSIRADENYEIIYDLIAKDASGDPVINSGTATWTVNGRKVFTETVAPGRNSFRIAEYLDASRKDGNTIKLTVSIETGGAVPSFAYKIWNIKAIDFKLKWDLELQDSFFNEDTFTLQWQVYGGEECETHIIFDDIQELNVGHFIKKIPAREANGSNIGLTFNSLDYGVHKVEMYLVTTIGKDTYYTDSIFKEIAFTKDGTTPLLLAPFYQTNATQYDTINIPFYVYDPINPFTTVQCLVNGNIESQDQYGREPANWAYMIPEAGRLELGLKCGNETKTFALDVQKLDLDVSEPGTPAFKLKANELSGNDQLKAWNYNNMGINFSENFDWKNGGIKVEQDEEGHSRKYICIKNNTYMDINYNLFRRWESGSGKLFKFIFKATNCYDYEASVLKCYDESSKIGLSINAQKATFVGGGESLTTQFCEDSYIELELEIYPDKSDASNGDRYIMFWVDGVPTGVRTYSHKTDFRQTNPQYIRVGSPDCDVYVYLVKAYETYLDKNFHVDNFIIDAPNVEKMLDRFERNDVVGNDGKISWSKVIEKNPSLPIHLYDIPRMTKNKKDKVSGCIYEQYKGDFLKPKVKCDNATIKVQGTSSAAYGVAAFNIDSDFGASLKDGDGNLLTYYDEDNKEITEYRGCWAMRENSIPIDFTCTKVNVASCENANNAVNAEWYNKFQPYWDAHRRKNPKARDCMEFTPGILFVKDRNAVGNSDIIYDDDGELVTNAHSSNAYRNVYSDDTEYMKKVYQVNSGTLNADSLPYYQYAICNMGNSKDNIHVFHDTTNPKACCVEVTDNQNREQWMTVEAKMDSFEEIEGVHDKFYEFRYPKNPSDEMKQKWLEFENWMARHDINPYHEVYHPNGYKGDALESPVTFNPKTFKGFNPPGFENEDSPSGVSLKGFTVSKYARDNDGNPIVYTHDTKEYRIAKFLDECEEHLVMDSIVYHYLFIERHTMVDNVAKNTFWSTEDGQHWDLTKNYDNDTADGNNNTGYLVYSYGIECMDDESETKKVFNASESVWFNFIHELYEVQKNLFAQLAEKGAWSASNYLNAFKSYQNIIPERCWIEDYFRKYIRPRRLDLDSDTYLKRLEGGQKTHQRKQYETYQEYYLSSKYETGIAQSTTEAIDTRLNSGESFNINTVIPVTTYIDCYPKAYIGGQTRKKRIKRKEVYEIPIGEMVATANDSTAYWYPAPYLQTMENLESLYPLSVGFKPAKKLRKISLGSDAEGYYNPNITTANFEGNTMLEELNIPNSGVSMEGKNLGTLNLSELKSLKKLNISGSTYTKLELADGGLVETMYLNGLEELRASNLTNLKTVVFDTDTQTVPGTTVGFISNIYRNLINLYINNCPAIDTYDLVSKSNIAKYELLNIDWVINNNKLVNGVLKNIDILDKLLAVSDKDASGKPINTQALLSGTVTIDQDCSVDVYEIYTKYCQYYPNLEIKYSDNVSDLNPAVKIIFLNNDDTSVAGIHYQVLGSGDINGLNSLTIGQLTSGDGPTGIALMDPFKPETQAYTYTFTHYWECDGILYYDNTINEDDALENSISLNKHIPIVDMTFVPVFKAEDRWYNVRFYADGKVVPQDRGDGTIVESYPVKYNTKYNGPIKNYLYKAHPEEGYRYKFLGWCTDPSSRNPSYTDVTNYTVLGNIAFYAYFKEESVFDNATSWDYFNVKNNEISLKPEYVNILEGKITLPLKTKSGNAITGIAANGFKDASKITHIYFEQGQSAYTSIGEGAFTKVNNKQTPAVLKAVYLPDGIKTIGNNCFRYQTALQTIALPDSIEHIGSYAFSGGNVNLAGPMSVYIDKLPDNLITLGDSAFWSGGPNITISYLPKGLTRIPGFAFAFCENVAIQEFGSNDENGLTTIELAAFYRAGQKKTIPVVTFYNTVSQISIDENSTHSFQESYLINTTKIEIYNDELETKIRTNGWPDITSEIDYL